MPLEEDHIRVLRALETLQTEGCYIATDQLDCSRTVYNFKNGLPLPILHGWLVKRTDITTCNTLKSIVWDLQQRELVQVKKQRLPRWNPLRLYRDDGEVLLFFASTTDSSVNYELHVGRPSGLNLVDCRTSMGADIDKKIEFVFLVTKGWELLDRELACDEETITESTPGKMTADRGDIKKATHAIDFRSVHWFGEGYTFTKNQAAIVKQLWEAWENGTPEMGDDTLLAEAESDTKELRHVFRGHPAWGKVFVEGSTKGTRRLNPPVE